jgi:NADH-quinone oxidoreductase subunit J
MFPTALLQVAADSPIAGMQPVAQYAVVGGVAVLAGFLAYRSLLLDRRGSAAGVWFAGLAVAAAAGFLGWLADGAIAFAVLYLVAASGAVLFYLPRQGEMPLWFALLFAGYAAGFAAYGPGVGAFALAAGLCVFGALKVLAAREIVHATVWLATTLLGVAVAFLAVGAQFLFLIQILVYIGAVITLFLFTVMLTIPTEESHFLDRLDLPPGIVIERVEELGEVTPPRGAGPMKGFDHPRVPTRVPPTMYGVTLSDNVYGTETTPKKGTAEKEGS